MNFGASDPRGDGAAIPEMPISTANLPAMVVPGRSAETHH